jgi:hypothetical protein
MWGLTTPRSGLNLKLAVARLKGCCMNRGIENISSFLTLLNIMYIIEKVKLIDQSVNRSVFNITVKLAGNFPNIPTSYALFETRGEICVIRWFK